jgi:y4mF family transcriptional regulator
MTPQQIGQAIRHKRKALGLTQEEAAGLCGVGITFLSRVERGQATAEIGKVFHVLHSLGLKVSIEGMAT